MPEMPDVEVFKRRLDEHALGRRLVAVHAPAPDILRDVSIQALGRRLHGRRCEESLRHGKYLFAGWGARRWLVMHFGMTGRLEPVEDADEGPGYTDLVLSLNHGSGLACVASRKLGMVALIEDPEAFVAERGPGPDVLSLDRARFADLAAERRGGVKCWLMKQDVMAGIGNVYAGEALFRARVHPKTALRELSGEDLAGLFDALTEVVAAAVEAEAEPTRMPEDFLLPRRKAGAACPRCGAPIERLKACGRSAFYCPRCLSAPRKGPTQTRCEAVDSCECLGISPEHAAPAPSSVDRLGRRIVGQGAPSGLRFLSLAC